MNAKQWYQRSTWGDRISSLPDCVLLQILSGVGDTRSAAQTTVLSRRWRNLWLSLQHLHLSQTLFPSPTSFDRFAADLFSLRRPSDAVLSLYFHRLGHDRELVPAMVRFAAATGVRFLKLRWIGIYKKDMAVVPSLPSVKSLVLRNVRFDAGSEGFDFFSWFPNLEDLCLLDSEAIFHEGGVLEICAPRLVRFAARNTAFRGVGGSKVLVSSPNLARFCVEGMVPDPVSVRARDPLEEAEVDFYAAPGEGDRACLVSLMQDLCSAQSILLSVGVVQALSKVLASQEQQPSPFRNLKCLKLKEFPVWKRFEMTDLVRSYLLGGSPLAKIIVQNNKQEVLFNEYHQHSRWWERHSNV